MRSSRSAITETVVDDYRFRPEDLHPTDRLPGIGAFMRIRNGADFLEPVIRGHIGAVDEIVAVYNQCTDETPDILARLQHEFGDRLRVFHYRPPVHPPGSDGHVATPGDVVESVVAYSNFALSQTRYRVAMKLDDDHWPMPGPLARLTARIRKDGIPPRETWSFSGINLGHDANGRMGIVANAPLVGFGDHLFFTVGPETYFRHDPRFERFRAPGRSRIFAGFLYWHLKYLKAGFGFGNYGLEAGNDRFRRKRDSYLADRGVVSLEELQDRVPFRRLLAFGEKARLRAAAWAALADGLVPDADFHQAVAAVGAWMQDRNIAVPDGPGQG